MSDSEQLTKVIDSREIVITDISLWRKIFLPRNELINEVKSLFDKNLDIRKCISGEYARFGTADSRMRRAEDVGSSGTLFFAVNSSSDLLHKKQTGYL